MTSRIPVIPSFGTTEENAALVGFNAEITVDTTEHTVVVHDGVTLGGTVLAKKVHTHTTSDVQGLQLALDSFATVDAVPSLAPVQSVAGRTGDVTLTVTDVAGLSLVAKTGNYEDLNGAPPVTDGTVTSVSVTAYNGLEADVRRNTTTPDIQLSLGDITPRSVVAQGDVSGSNLSGTNTGDETAATIKSKLGITTLSGVNTGDQTITLVGDVSGSGTSTIEASLVDSGVVPGTYKQVTVTSKGVVIEGSNPTTLSGYGITDAVPKTLVGTPEGLATLDSSGKLTANQVPESLTGGLTYQGVWNAATNTPALQSNIGTKGHYYKVSVAGNTLLNGNSNWTVGDIAAFNGVAWDQIQGGSSDVTSVFGRVGAVVLTSKDVTDALAPGSITNSLLENPHVAALTGTNTGDETTATIKSKLGVTTLSGVNTGDQTITLVGDVTGSGTGVFATSLSDTGVAPGSYTKVTVDSKGRVKAASSIEAWDVATALGFIPYNSQNPDGYINIGQVPVQSVSGRTGDIVLTSFDVGLDKVTNERALPYSSTLDVAGDVLADNTFLNSGLLTTRLAPVQQANSGAFLKVTLDSKGRVVGNTPVTQSDLLSVLGTSTVPNASHAETANTVITNANLTGEVTSVGNVTTVDNSAVIAKQLTGLDTTPGVVNAADSIVSAIGKLVGKVNASNGTVTSVAVSTANGVSGSVENASTTPFITFTLGDITPSSVVSPGIVSGVNLSGTNTGDETADSIRVKLGVTTLSGVNTGDQTITLTGAVTGSGKGTFVTTLSDSGVVAGSYTKVSVDTKGRVTHGSNPSTLLEMGITDGVSSSFVGVPNGLATLDANGKLPAAQFPGTVIGALTYRGVWDAAVNSPAILSSVGVKGHYYKVSVAGSTEVDGNSGWTVGDMILFNGTTWDQIQGGSSDVTSVFGRVGAVVLTSADVTGALGYSPYDQSNPAGYISAANAPVKSVAGRTGDIVLDANDINTALGNSPVALASTVLTNASLTGEVTSVGNSATLQNSAVINKVLTGLNTTAGTVLATDSIVTAIGKLAGRVNASGGTVTSVSVTTANGVSGTVNNATSTPAISLTLGDITPSSVAASGFVSGSNLSGTNTGDETAATIKSKLGITTLSGVNTGDQTITLTGDVTGSGTGSFATSLANTTVVAGSYGSATTVPTFTVDAKGRLSAAGTVPIAPAWSSITGIPVNLTAIAGLSGIAGFLRTNGSGTWSVDQTTYVTSVAGKTGSVITLNNNDVGLGNVTNVAQVNKAGDTMTGELILSTSSPSNALTAASRGYVDTKDFSNKYPQIGFNVGQNEVPVYSDFQFAFGHTGTVGNTIVDSLGREVVYFSAEDPIQRVQTYMGYRYTVAANFTVDGNPVTCSFLNPNEYVRLISHVGTHYAVLVLSSTVVPYSYTRTVIVRTSNSAYGRDWTLAYDVSSLTFSVRASFELHTINGVDRILRLSETSGLTVDVYDSSLTLLRSINVFNSARDVNTVDQTGAGRTGPSVLSVGYQPDSETHPGLWNKFTESYHAVFSCYYTITLSNGVKQGIGCSVNIAWSMPAQWLLDGTGPAPSNLITIKSGAAYRYHTLSDSSWDTDTGGMSTLIGMGYSISLTLDEYSKAVYLNRRGSWDTVSMTVSTCYNHVDSQPILTFCAAHASRINHSFSAPIPDASAWSKSVNGAHFLLSGNTVMFTGNSYKYGSKTLTTTFSTSEFKSVVHPNDTFMLSPTAVNLAPTSGWPAVVAANVGNGGITHAVNAGVVTTSCSIPGNTVYSMSAASGSISWASSGLTVPALPTSISAIDNIVLDGFCLWNGDTVSPIYYALVKSTSTLRMYIAKCQSGIWSIVSADIGTTQLEQGNAARGDTTYSHIGCISRPLLTESGMLLWMFTVPGVGSTQFYLVKYSTASNTATIEGSTTTFWPRFTSNVAGNYKAGDGYTYTSFGYDPLLGYFAVVSSSVGFNLSVLSSRDPTGVGAELTESQWLTPGSARYETYIATEAATGLYAYLMQTDIFLGGYYCTIPTSTLALTPSAVNYLYVSKDSSDRNVATASVSLTPLPINSSRLLLAKVTTDATHAISSETFPYTGDGLPPMSGNGGKMLMTDGRYSFWGTYSGVAASANALNAANNYQMASLGVGVAPSGVPGEIRAVGNITANYSDDRLKTRLGFIELAREKIRSLDAFYYEANITAQSLGYKATREVGVSAQQVQAVLPEVVAAAPISDEYLTVRYERLTPLLIAGFKELDQEVQSLREELSSLHSLVNRLIGSP